MSAILETYWGAFSNPFYYDFFNMFTLTLFLVVILKILVMVIGLFYKI